MSFASFNIKDFWKPILLGAAVVFLYAGVLAKLGRDWWTDENYSHGLLVPFVIGFIIWSEWDAFREVLKKPRVFLGLGLISTALVFLLGGTLGAELFTQRVSFVVLLGGLVVYFFGTRIFQLLIVPFALLLLSIPIPQIIFNKIAFPLQIWASQAAVWGIRLFEVPTTRKGNVIEILPNGATQIIALEVVEACSGIRSLMTLVTLALILAYFTREDRFETSRGWKAFFKSLDFWRAVILMVSAVPIAVLTNAARVTATGILTYYYGKQATEGTFHDLSGWLVYLVALILLIGINIGIKKVFALKWLNSNSKTEAEPPSQITNHKSQIVNPIWLIAFLFIGGLFINWFEHRGEVSVPRKPLAELPLTLGDWRQKGSEIKFGEQTESVLRVSDYTMREYLLPDGRLANIYVGYYASQRTGATYHSPQNCLPGAGWVMKEPELIEIKLKDGRTFSANRYIIENGIYKEVMIYWYSGRGRTEASEYRDKINTVWDSTFRRRSDGAMVRVMTSVGGDERSATEKAADLSARLAEQLNEFVPE